MADLTRTYDWSSTPVGPIHLWPNTLLITVNTLLASRQPMFLWWGVDLIQFYNDAYRPSLGADKHPSALGQRGQECWEEIWPIIGPQIDAVMARGEASWHEDQLVPIYRGGVLEDVYWTYGYSPVRDPSGNICATLVTCFETTARLLAERKLRTSQKQYTELFESAPDAIFVANVDGCICEVNLAACNLLGFGRDELQGRNYADAIAEQDRPGLWRTRDQLLQGGSSVEEWELLTNDGSRIPSEVSTTILPDGRWQAFVRDISHRKRLEAERSKLLREVQGEWARVEDLFRQAPAFFAVLRGPEHIFELINPLYQELVGERDVIGRSVREAVPEAEEQGFFGLLDRVYQTGVPFVGHSTPIKLARSLSGPLEERYIDFVYQPMREADGTISGIIALGVDVTQRKRTQETLIQNEKLAVVGRLASSIAHEINNPLESVTNLLYLLGITMDPDVRQQYLAQAQSELARVAKITTQTLRFHRQSTKAQETFLAEIMESVLALMEGKLSGSDISVDRRYRTARQILAYEADLRQVFANLVGNAIDACGPGARIVIDIRDATNWVSGETGVKVVIADNGSGMSAETLRHIFEPFFTTKAATGTGLGLWISAGILQNHRAKLRVRSSQSLRGRGTVFSIFFPVNTSLDRV